MKNLLPILLCLSFTIQAQPAHIFTQYTADDGFDQNMVNSILQDHKGFLWFATWDGITRFDGNTFRNYKSSADSIDTFISNRISSMTEDIYGCIWTLGYDKRISRLNPKTEKFTAFPDVDCFVKQFHVLPNGHTWIVTENKGLLLITTNEADLSFRIRKFSESELPAALKVVLVSSDCDGNDWILTETGVFVHNRNNSISHPIKAQQTFTDMEETDRHLYFSSDNGQLWKYKKDTGRYDIIQLPISSQITVVQALMTGEIFCGTYSDGFFVLSPDSKQKQHYNTTLGVMRDDQVKSVYMDRHGELWIQQKTKGVTHFNPKTREMHYFAITDKQGNRIVDGRIRQFVFEDKQGNLYIHPSGGGLAYYDRINKRLVPLYNEQLMDGWSQSDLIMYVYMDKQDNIWLSSHANGLEKITFKSEQFRFYAPPELQPEQINNRSAFIDRDNRLWIGCSHRGITVYDAQHRFLGYLQANGTLSKGEGSLRVVACSITQDREGTIWIGLKKHGVIALRPGSAPQTFRISRFQFDKANIYSLSDNDVYHIHEDGEGRIWFATLNGGVNYLQREADGTHRFINYRNELKNYPVQACSRTRFITSDNQRRLWLATADGLLQFNEKFAHPSQLTFNHIRHVPGDPQSLNSNEIQYIHQTARGELFVATFGGGLNKLLSLDNGKARFKAYTKEDGLPSNILLTMGEDPEGNIWISMMDALCRFDPETEQVENYTAKEFPGAIKFNEGAGCYSSVDEALLFNTQQGLLSFQPKAVHKSTYEPPIVFTQLQLADLNILPNDSTGILDITIDETSQLVLTHKQKSFSLRFAALDMSDPYNISYVYRLKGFEEQWNKTEKNHVAHYTNIPKGDYVLEVRSTNSDGVWTENVRRLDIRVLPSFWETPWAYSLYLLILIGIVLIIVYVLFTFFRLRHEVTMEKKLSEHKLKFFTNISHELRTPLTLISGPVKNVLERYDLHPAAQHQLQLVDRNINRMMYLINQILDFRKIQNRKMKMRVQQIEVLSFLRHLMECFQSLAQESRIDFSLETNKPVITLWADADKLEKILFNLIANAFKYTPPGKKIKIIVLEEEKDVTIHICDEGVGIPKEKQKFLFKRFETATDANPLNQASTGIGLSLAKELIEMHKGTISLQSEPDRGSTFSIHLKKGKDHFVDKSVFVEGDGVISYLYDSDATAFLSVQQDYENSTADVVKLTEKKTLLFVEDNQELRNFLKTAFASEFTVLEAENGAIGLAQARKHVPDIIISDVMMPEMNGTELLRELRQDMEISHIPVILLTSKTAIESQIEGIELGADDYMTKPFSAAYLKARVLNIMEQRRKLQEYYRNTLLNDNGTSAANEITTTITSNNQAFMNRLIKSINKHLNNSDLKIEDLAQEIGMSRGVFAKKIRSLTGLSPVEYLREVRLKHAASLILSSDLSMAQIAYEVGFNDPHYFSKCFSKQFGISPTDYRAGDNLENS